jgi:hypothetical protein
MMLVALTSPATVMRRLFELLAVPNRRALLKDKSRSVVRQLPPNRTNHAEALNSIRMKPPAATVRSHNIGFPNSIAKAAAAVAAVEPGGGSSI